MKKNLAGIVPLRRETLQTSVYQQLCSLILEGNLVPGESISVASIAKAFDVSPMPVRDAISRLTAAGVLSVVSGRSVGVPKLDQAALVDLRNVRSEIETVAVRWATKNKTDSFMKELEGCLRNMIKAETEGKVTAFILANYKFHFAIYRQSHSPLLIEIVSNLWLRINPYFHHLADSGHYKISNAQHRIILQAIGEGNADAAEKALRCDIDGAYQTLLETIG